MSKPRISVIIPARNEEGRIGAAVSAVRATLIEGGYDTEVIVVDDGSRDGTAREAGRAIEGRNVRLVTHVQPRGKGAAIASGIRVSTGDLVGFIDADLEYPAEALPQMARMICERGSDTVCVAAVRTRDERHKIDSITSRIGRSVAGPLLRLGIRDTQAGLKMFPGRFARRVLAGAKETGWLFDVEALVLAVEHRLTILEIPVTQRSVRRRRTGILDMLACALPLLRYAVRRHSPHRHQGRPATSQTARR